MGESSIKEIFLSFIYKYGNLAVFCGLALEYLGLPVPGETMLSLMGFLNKTLFSAVLSIFVSAAGTFTGSMAAYGIGRKFGEPVVLKLGKPFHITGESLNKTRLFLQKHEGLYIVLSRFIPGVRHVVPYLTGINRLNTLKVVAYNILSSFIWCSFFISIGYFLGSQWKIVEHLVHQYTLIILIILLFIFVVYKVFNKHKFIIYIFSAAVFTFIKFASELMEQELRTFDNAVYTVISSFISTKMTALMKFISFLGTVPVLVVVSVSVLLILWKTKKPLFYGWMAAVNLFLIFLLNVLFKFSFHRERPDILRLITETGYSFPSGHSMIGLSFYGFMIYLSFLYLKKPWKYISSAFLCVLILMIGISRIYLGVHYASDVAAGFSAGLAWLIMFTVLSNRIYYYRFNYADRANNN